VSEAAARSSSAARKGPDFVKEASKRGVFAHISDADVEDWQSSIDIVLRRFAEYHDLQGALGRRALTERARGILMERHAIDEPSASELLREHSREANRKLIDEAALLLALVLLAARSAAGCFATPHAPGELPHPDHGGRRQTPGTALSALMSTAPAPNPASAERQVTACRLAEAARRHPGEHRAAREGERGRQQPIDELDQRERDHGAHRLGRA
jgi:hypothetical protein